MGMSELAGRQGFEPRYRGPEPRVLPLDDLPVSVSRDARARNSYSSRTDTGQSSAGVEGVGSGEPPSRGYASAAKAIGSPDRSDLRQVVGADHLLGIRCHRVVVRRAARLGRVRRHAAALLLLLPPVA